MSEEQPIFTALEEAKLRQFTKLVDDSISAERKLGNGEAYNCVLKIPGQQDQLLFPMDYNYIQGLRGIASAIYNTELAPNPVLREAALDQVHIIEEKYRAMDDPEIATLRTMLGELDDTHKNP